MTRKARTIDLETAGRQALPHGNQIPGRAGEAMHQTNLPRGSGGPQMKTFDHPQLGARSASRRSE